LRTDAPRDTGVLQDRPEALRDSEGARFRIVGALRIAAVKEGADKMRYRRAVLAFLVSASNALASQALPQSLPQLEKQALVDIFRTTNGTQWEHASGWLQTDDPCEWFGVI